MADCRPYRLQIGDLNTPEVIEALATAGRATDYIQKLVAGVPQDPVAVPGPAIELKIVFSKSDDRVVFVGN